MVTRRYDLGAQCKKKGYKIGAEIGVNTGSYSKLLVDTGDFEKFYGIDCWTGEYEKSYQKAKKTLAPYDNYEIIRGLSGQIKDKFEDEHFDFIYIDAAHDYKNVMIDLAAWWPKIKKGGLFAGHDYNNKRGKRVRKAVDEFFGNLGLKVESTTKDPCPTWFIYKSE